MAVKRFASRKEQMAAWRASNKEHIREQQIAYRAVNREKIAAKAQENAEAIAAYQRIYRKENREVLAAKKREYYLAHKDHIEEKKRLWVEQNRARQNAYQRDWYAAHLDDQRCVKREASKARRIAKFSAQDEDLKWFYRAVMSSPQITCYLCGGSIEGKGCHIDHVVPLSRGGAHTLSNLRPTCPTCNLRKNSRLVEELPPNFFTSYERSVV